MMVRFSAVGAFCASAPVARKPVTAQSAQAANPRRVNIRSSLVVHIEIPPDRRPLSSRDGALGALRPSALAFDVSSRVAIGNETGAFGDHRDAGVLRRTSRWNITKNSMGSCGSERFHPLFA